MQGERAIAVYGSWAERGVPNTRASSARPPMTVCTACRDIADCLITNLLPFLPRMSARSALQEALGDAAPNGLAPAE